MGAAMGSFGVGHARFTYTRSQRAGEAGSVIEPHLLASITDADGRVIASQEFDAYGRLIASRDAQGQRCARCGH